MKKLMLAGVVVGVVTGACGRAAAQVPYTPPQTSPFFHPPVSPYINLNRAGTSPAVAYYGIVQPQLQTYAIANAFQQQINANQAGITNLQQGASLPVTTGHAIAFMNTGGYFLNFNPPQGQVGFMRTTAGTGTGLAGTSTGTALNRPAGGGATGTYSRPTTGGTSPFGR